jgi:hypothetical protein
MDPYAGWDMSLKETLIAVRQNRERIWRGKCLSDTRRRKIRKHDLARSEHAGR